MKYGFIGCGNMGGAIARALSKTTKDIMISDRSGKAKALAAELGYTYGCVSQVVQECERIFLAVKPQMMESVMAPLQPLFAEKKPLLITMAAGLKLEKIQLFAATELPIIRIMPNTPVAVGMGMIPYCCNDLVSQEQLESFLDDMQFAGKLDALEESLIDAASALSGSGPAYMYLFLESLRDGAVACGMQEDKALDYAVTAMAGAAEMVRTSPLPPAVLREAVCSPGGSTIAGLNKLSNHSFREAVRDCVVSAYRRNLELGQ